MEINDEKELQSWEKGNGVAQMHGKNIKGMYGSNQAYQDELGA